MTKKKRAAFVLFAATASTAVAGADPSPKPPTPATIQPRTLATGAPACGNVVGKYMAEPRPCRTARTILTEVTRKIEEIRETVAVFDWIGTTPSSSLTLGRVGRPRS